MHTCWICSKECLSTNTICKCKNEILFSPSAASFDSFKNFEERGMYFNYLIKKLNFIKNVNAK